MVILAATALAFAQDKNAVLLPIQVSHTNPPQWRDTSVSPSFIFSLRSDVAYQENGYMHMKGNLRITTDTTQPPVPLPYRAIRFKLAK